MLVYIEWKIDLQNPNKVNILRIRKEKDLTIKYTIARHKFGLGSVELNNNFNQDQVFFTRVNIGAKRENKVNLMVFESISNINKNIIIEICMFGTPNTQTTVIKDIHRMNIFLNEHNYPIIPENEIDVELNKFVKEIKKNKIQTKIDKYGNPYTLYLSEINAE